MFARNISLKAFNTFGIDHSSNYFGTFSSTEDLQLLLKDSLCKEYPILPLGGGSNILLTKDFQGIVLKNEILGIEELGEDNQYHYIKVGAGVNWHSFVLHAISKNWYGIENLSLIPGNVGASPMQNIGAYGAELRHVFNSLEAVNIETGEIRRFDAQECAFGYRESVFKNELKNQFIITSVTYQLKKKPSFNIEYGVIKEELERLNVTKLSLSSVSQAIINIRKSKLPDPTEIGNAGSFFKNPIISVSRLNELKKAHPSIPNYPMNTSDVKLAAGWLIEQAGWKGYQEKTFGVHKNQALVLVNYGNSFGADIYDLSTKIVEDVSEKFGVQLEREVNII